MELLPLSRTGVFERLDQLGRPLVSRRDHLVRVIRVVMLGRQVRARRC